MTRENIHNEIYFYIKLRNLPRKNEDALPLSPSRNGQTKKRVNIHNEINFYIKFRNLPRKNEDALQLSPSRNG